MSEATKLKNLLNKTKPTIQLEVRKKQPILTTEFLEYAKEREELFQLSNINIDNNTNNNHQPAKTEHFSSLTTTPSSTNRYPANNFSNKYPSGYARNFSYNPNTFNNRNIRS
ncbi:unnamed protein product [Rotaria sp. Silwood2]|nr:unnamed protein product [Rotaria sp. Silwood2]